MINAAAALIISYVSSKLVQGRIAGDPYKPIALVPWPAQEGGVACVAALDVHSVE